MAGLSLHLPRTVYRAGEEVTGTVEIGEPCKITVRLEWRASGFPSASGTAAAIILEAGQSSFSLRLPASPISCQGKLTSIEWVVRATPHVAGKDWVQSITVHPKERPAEQLVGAGGYRDPAQVASSRTRRPIYLRWQGGLFLLISLGMMVPFALLLWISPSPPLSSGIDGVLAVACLVGIIGAGIAVILLWLAIPSWLRRLLVARRFDIDDVEITQESCRGGKVDVLLNITRLRNIDRLEVRLVGMEAASTGYASGTQTRQEELHSERQVFAGEALRPRRLEIQFQVPESAPLSYAVEDASVTWYVEVHAYIARWPDWCHTYLVTIGS